MTPRESKFLDQFEEHLKTFIEDARGERGGCTNLEYGLSIEHHAIQAKPFPFLRQHQSCEGFNPLARDETLILSGDITIISSTSTHLVDFRH